MRWLDRGEGASRRAARGGGPTAGQRRHDDTGARRRRVADRRTVRRDEGPDRRVQHDRVCGSGRGHRGGVEASLGEGRADRGAAGLGAVTPEIEAAVAEAFREEWGQVVAALIGVTGDWDLAEECAQDAFALALERWPRDGVPRRPGAWLSTVARNRATDRLRREATGAAKLQEAAVVSPDDQPNDSDAHDDSGVEDDR